MLPGVPAVIHKLNYFALDEARLSDLNPTDFSSFTEEMCLGCQIPVHCTSRVINSKAPEKLLLKT